MAKARYMPGRAVYGTTHRVVRRGQRNARHSPQLGWVGSLGFVIALAIFLLA